jgi:hypothetical protein
MHYCIDKYLAGMMFLSSWQQAAPCQWSLDKF